MAIFKVTLDGGETQPERSGDVTVDAKTAQEAKDWAEQQNPGLTAIQTEKIG